MDMMSEGVCGDTKQWPPGSPPLPHNQRGKRAGVYGDTGRTKITKDSEAASLKVSLGEQAHC